MEKPIADRPMTRRLLRWLGSLMRAFGVLGIATSLIVAVGILFLPSRLIPVASDALISAAASLREISSSIDQAGSGMISAAAVLDTAGTTVLDIAHTVESTQPLIESAAGVIENIGEKTLQETNQALDSAQAAAQAVDKVLRGLSVIGAITGISYDPERSLDQAIQDVANGLESLPQGLIEVSDRLYDTAAGFAEVSDGLDQTGGDLKQLSVEMHEMGEGLEKLASQISDQVTNLYRLVERLPAIIWVSVGVVELLLLGFVLAQITVINVGRQLVQENLERIR